jgi:hypothetical protein
MNIVPKGTGTQASTAPTSTQTFNTGTAPNSARERALAAYRAATPSAPPEAAPKTAAQVRAELESADDGQKNLNEDAQLQPQQESESQVVEASEPVTDEGQETQEPSESTEEESKEDPALSSQYAALARRERALRAQAMKQEQAIKAREAALAAREAELAGKSAEPDYSNYISKDMLKQDALRALAEANVSYEELTQQILNQGSMDPRAESMLKNMEGKIAKLEAEIEKRDKAAQEAKSAEYQNAVKQITNDVKKMVTLDPSYEMIKLTNSYKDVVELIEAKFKEDGTLLSNEEAAQMVEDYLVEEAERLAKASKIQKRLQPAASKQVQNAPVQQPAQKPSQTQPQIKTLTNSNSVSRQLTAKERAVLAFKGQLK